MPDSCHVCGTSRFKHVFVKKLFDVKGKHYIIENIPADQCENCAEIYFQPGTTESVRRMIHEHQEPLRKETVHVFRLTA